jgi:uracil-DNA glycosylase family 4
MLYIGTEDGRLPIICDNCPSCPIWQKQLSPKQVTTVRQPKVLREPIVLFVGQHPAKEEMEKEMAFVGYSSEMFVEKLRDVGLWDHSILTNIIKCVILPETDVNDELLRAAAKCCSINLMKEIQKYRPQYICLLGAIAAGEFFRAIRVKRPPHGEFVRWRGIWVCWTYHPAAAVRNPNLWGPITDTLMSVRRRVAAVGDAAPPFNYEVVSTPAEVEDVCRYFSEREVIACDIEVDVVDPAYRGYQLVTRGKTKAAQVLAVGLSDGERTVVIADKDGLLDFPSLSPLRDLIFRTVPRKVYHNALFELMWFHRLWGAVPSPRSFADTMLMYYVLDEERDDHEYGLKNMAMRLLGAPSWVDDRVQEARRTAGLGKLSWDELCRYNANDAYWTVRLYHYLQAQIREADLDFLLSELIYPLECLYAVASDRGIAVNTDLLRKDIANIVRQRLDALTVEIKQLSKGYIKNPRSWQEKKYYLYQVLRLQPPEEGDETTRRQVLSYFLEHYPEHSEILSRLIEFSQLDKLYSSYLRQWTKFVDIDGRIRPEFKFFGTRTGRLSVEEPPFHNFPSERTESGRQARRIFVPTSGYCFLECDASQFEVRVMAAKSGDPNLIEAFYSGNDVYTEVASIIFRKPPEEIDRKRERQIAKQVVLGIFYGMSSFGLARLLRLPEEEANLYISRLREHYPEVFRYMEAVHAFGKQYGFVRNWLGRYRRAYAAVRGDPRALRQIGNFVIQSEASDWWQMVTLWFVRLSYKRLGSDAVALLATIHDSMLAEVRVGCEEQALECLRDAMTLVSARWQLAVPIDGEFRFCYQSLGDEGEKQPLGITAMWRAGLAERGLQLMEELHLSPFRRRGL